MSQKFLFLVFAAVAQAQQTSGQVAPEALRLGSYEVQLRALDGALPPAPEGEAMDQKRSRLATAARAFFEKNQVQPWSAPLPKDASPTLRLIQFRLAGCERTAGTVLAAADPGSASVAEVVAVMNEAIIVWVLATRPATTEERLRGHADVASFLVVRVAREAAFHNKKRAAKAANQK